MDKPSREKIALLVFAALIVLSLAGLGWYIFAGHSWNVAASSIDDTFGEMDGYTAIVYPGTLEESAEKGAAGAAGKGAGAGGASDAKGAASADGDGVADAAKGSASAGSAAGNAAEGTAGAAASGASSNDAAAGAGSKTASGASGTGSDTARSGAASGGRSASLGVLGVGEAAEEPVDAAAVGQEYRDKGAAVLDLDLENLARYEEGSILKRGGKRIGIISAGEGVSQLDVARCIATFQEAGVDFTVCITPDKWKVERISGIDICLCLKDEGLPAMGESQDGTFYVDAPVAGRAGVILVSPSNVVSAKEVAPQ
ncbi:MAG TPA: alcohol dehydrogenase [Candidatus Aphodovivens avistercoris]|nr:alcohol dehydrogenase [Candidatus Aphodovivens avistercoris]